MGTLGRLVLELVRTRTHHRAKYFITGVLHGLVVAVRKCPVDRCRVPKMFIYAYHL